ncbi:unnamed protein product [Periconia digitata]|uniref:Laccase n=1 Tax=Periconia digitata TaxID=1303443 RepID=A0A9W4UH39_9PLEO|nr:unnamed protein product [Periconia digitata]
MRGSTYVAFLGTLLCSSVNAFPAHADADTNASRAHLEHNADWTPKPSQNCEHGPKTRRCWTGDLDVLTDMDDVWPDTGVYRKYTLEITNATMAPDGFPRDMQVVNGQYPGPTIEANWGDILQITVINRLHANGTGIHWHGIRQLETNEYDGTGGLTECPIPPGASKVYTFRATQYGSSWYHSHYSVQYGDGVLGGIIIHGPATQNYDIDLGIMPMTDWFHSPIFTVNSAAHHEAHGPPIADNILINGTMTSPYGGAKPETTLTPGKTHRLRLVNTGINNWIHASLDNHTFTVIAADFVPIEPFETTELSIAIGQRYDVLIHATQPSTSYYFRVGTGGSCDGPNPSASEARGIFRYADAPDLLAEPVSVAAGHLMEGCWDEQNLVPVQRTQVPRDIPQEMLVGFDTTNASTNGVHWLIDGKPMKVDVKKPTLMQITDGKWEFEGTNNVYRVGEKDTFQYWVIQQSDHMAAFVPHPIHLHGHDFYVLDQVSDATWNGNASQVDRLRTDNPIRRDTATLPANGYLVLAFESDNPGVWLMHCHIPFHVGQGFGMQFVERQEEILGSIERLDDIKRECGDWKAFQESFYGVDFEFEETLV